MCRRKSAAVTIILVLLPAVCHSDDWFDPRFKDREHLTALELYKMGGTSQAIKEVAGRFVVLDVVVSISRDTPLVAVVVPGHLKEGESPSIENSPPAHLVGMGSQVVSLKAGDRIRIEGIIVNEGYNAYVVYVHQVLKWPNQAKTPPLTPTDERREP